MLNLSYTPVTSNGKCTPTAFQQQRTQQLGNEAKQDQRQPDSMYIVSQWYNTERLCATLQVRHSKYDNMVPVNVQDW